MSSFNQTFRSRICLTRKRCHASPGRRWKVGLGLVTLSHQWPILTSETQFFKSLGSLVLSLFPKWYVIHRKSHLLVRILESLLNRGWSLIGSGCQSSKPTFDSWQAPLLLPKPQIWKFWGNSGETSFPLQPFHSVNNRSFTWQFDRIKFVHWKSLLFAFRICSGCQGVNQRRENVTEKVH